MFSYLLEMFPLLPFFTCDPLCIAFGVHRLWWLKFVTFFFSLATEEKKSLKRTFQQIQEEEDDDYPGSYSPQDPSAGPLLVCLDPQGRAGRVVWSDLWLEMMATRWRRWPIVWNRWRVALWALGATSIQWSLPHGRLDICLCMPGLWHGFMFYSVHGFGFISLLEIENILKKWVFMKGVDNVAKTFRRPLPWHVSSSMVDIYK